jgi:predicted nuclease of restriction endonuclease-like (RecB) superfamily
MNLPANTEHFPPVLTLIQQAKSRALSTVNQQLQELYWQIGEYLSIKVAEQSWGKHVVQQLADWLAGSELNLRGFSAQNLWRMKQFFETYQSDVKLSTLLRELPWSSHLHIMSKCQTAQEREFALVPKLPLGNPEREALASQDRKLELPAPNSQAGAWELAKNRDHDVVEYALSRSLSPTLVAQYQTRLPDKALLQAKLDEFYELAKLESGQ